MTLRFGLSIDTTEIRETQRKLHRVERDLSRAAQAITLELARELRDEFVDRLPKGDPVGRLIAEHVRVKLTPDGAGIFVEVPSRRAHELDREFTALWFHPRRQSGLTSWLSTQSPWTTDTFPVALSSASGWLEAVRWPREDVTRLRERKQAYAVTTRDAIRGLDSGVVFRDARSPVTLTLKDNVRAMVADAEIGLVEAVSPSLRPGLTRVRQSAQRRLDKWAEIVFQSLPRLDAEKATKEDVASAERFIERWRSS